MNISFTKRSVQIFLACAVLAIFLGLFFVGAPLSYPQNSVITIPEGATVRESGDLLKEKGALRSALLFSALVELVGDKGVIAGTYALKKKENVISLAHRFSNGNTGITLARVTIPEGLASFETVKILSRSLGVFDAEGFEVLARPEEGYLFPETYFFLPNTPAEEVIEVMRRTFDEKILPLRPKIEAFGRPLGDIVIMASILEREARQSETRRIVAGILWKRMSLKMPLQVDAPFGYVLQKSGYAPTLTDLKMDSPYNTYLNRGLPPGPIGNPGLAAIEDAVTPTKTPYLYYLTGKDGEMYYAKTFEEHVANKSKLR